MSQGARVAPGPGKILAAMEHNPDDVPPARATEQAQAEGNACKQILGQGYKPF